MLINNEGQYLRHIFNLSQGKDERDFSWFWKEKNKMTGYLEEINATTPDYVNLLVDNYFDEQEPFLLMKQRFDQMLKGMGLKRSEFAKLIGYEPKYLASIISRGKKKDVFPRMLVRFMSMYSYTHGQKDWQEKQEEPDLCVELDKWIAKLEEQGSNPETLKRLKEASFWYTLGGEKKES